MSIEQIFSKKLSRNINGVVKADQLDEKSIWVELDEYVVTNELDHHLRSFFENYLPAVQQPDNPDVSGDIGVWVSGFFGSGKSHFIKILSYLLENREVSYEGQTKKAAQFFKEKINDAMLYGDIHASVNRDTDVILFNIDSRANSDDKEDSILKVFLKVFNEHLGYSEDYPHLAHMERELDNDGLYQSFKDEYFNLTQNEWIEERKKFRFRKDKIVKTLSLVTNQTEESAREWINSLEKDFPLTIANFSKWVKEYIDKHQDKNVIFLVDEVGQFIGTNTQMMLKLQTITENLGTTCGGRTWVIVTSQEDIDSVLGDLEAKEGKDFSKIQGRFKTRISLSSSNTNEVIQKRLLSKTDDAREELGVIYNKQCDILKNQLAFDSTTTAELSSFQDNVDFIDNYPFVPYQYILVQKVFESVRNAGATGKHLSRGERSLLDAFQNAAQQVKKVNIGALIPFYRFYPAIESFLDTLVKMTIDQACAKRTLTPFDGDVLKTLFLIRYVDVVKSTLDNLVTLSISEIDTDKIALKKEIEESLNRLEREMLIARNNDEYAFLTNEEKEIQNEIRHTDIETSEVTRKLAEVVFKDILKGQSKYRYLANNQDFEISRFCDGVPIDGKADNDLVLKIVSPLQMGYADYKQDSFCASASATDNGHVLIRLPEQSDGWEELTTFLKTERFLRHNNRSTRPEQEKLLNEKASDNTIRGKRLKTQFTELAQSADIFAIGNKLEPKGTSFGSVIDESYKYVIENSFKYLDMLKACDDPVRELKAVLTASDISALGLDIEDPDQNGQALAELERYSVANDELNRAVYLKDILIYFGKRPFGWRREEVMLLVAKLALAGRLSFTLAGAPLQLKRSLDAFNSVRSHGELRVRRTKQHNDGQLQKAKKIGKNLFHKPFNGSEADLENQFKSQFDVWEKNLKSFENQANKLSHCPGKSVIEDGLRLCSGVLEQTNSYSMIERIIQDSADLDLFQEQYEDVEDFFDTQFETWKLLVHAIHGKFKANHHALEKDQDAHTALIELEAIYNNKAPYTHLKNVAGLIEKVEAVNTKLLDDKRQHALTIIDKRIDNIQQELKASNLPAEQRNKALLGLQQRRKLVDSADAIDQIIAGQAESKQLEATAIDSINIYNESVRLAEEKRIKEEFLKNLKDDQEKKTKKDSDEACGGDEVKVDIKPQSQPQRVVTPKPIKTIDPTLVKVASVYLENQDDVEQYLNALRSELNAAIDSGNRVRLETIN
ncbi:MAG: BREX system P-loop protein BrxC [Endozoicomonadaceae bacterium]|nr:BREX system P-loop protein BrxC [Endozoicomonadaceae bacterium]